MVIYHGLPRLRCWGFWRTLQAKGEDDGQWSALRHLFFSRNFYFSRNTRNARNLSLRDGF